MVEAPEISGPVHFCICPSLSDRRFVVFQAVPRRNPHRRNPLGPVESREPHDGHAGSTEWSGGDFLPVSRDPGGFPGVVCSNPEAFLQRDLSHGGHLLHFQPVQHISPPRQGRVRRMPNL